MSDAVYLILSGTVYAPGLTYIPPISTAGTSGTSMAPAQQQMAATASVATAPPAEKVSNAPSSSVAVMSLDDDDLTQEQVRSHGLC